MYRITIVEDDEKLRNQLQIFLSKNGYEVSVLEIFEHIVEELTQQNPDLILLDLNLPCLNGEYICSQIRKTSDVPIIIITSKNTELDELISLNNGADDFVTKPFNTQILLAKIGTILKRVYQAGKNQNVIDCGDFKVDVSRSLLQKEDKVMDLTKNELKIVYYLAKKKGEIISRDEIITYLWDSEMFVDDNTLTVNINRLRKKLEELGLTDKIETKRGQGYRLV